MGPGDAKGSLASDHGSRRAALATAGNLVFQGGKAYNAETGQKLWEIDLGGNAVTPISYMLDGKQYISFLARPQTISRVFTFVLDGNAEMPPAPPPPAGRGGRGGATKQ